MNTILYFEIQASDPKKLIAFYTTVFGWKFILDKKIPIEYYRIETDGIHGGLLERPSPAPPVGSTNAFTCSIEVENFDDIVALIHDNGGKVAMPKFAIPGKCWQGYFIDPDNNTFGIFEVDENAENSTF